MKTLAALHEAGLPTFAFGGPLLPHFAEKPELLDHLFGCLAAAGVREVYLEHINFKQYIRERMNLFLAEKAPDAQEAYSKARFREHRAALDAIVPSLVAKHGLTLRFRSATAS